MKLQFSIQQKNTKNEVVFVAKKVVNIGNAEIDSVSKDVNISAE